MEAQPWLGCLVSHLEAQGTHIRATGLHLRMRSRCFLSQKVSNLPVLLISMES